MVTEQDIEETATTEEDGSSSLESTITILQPVLTWGNTETGWSMASWNCCPTGQTWISDSITGLQENQTLVGEITVGEEYATVVSKLEGGDSVELRIQNVERTFDWMDVTQEVY